MKVLVIPDCHLKPFMFEEAHELLENGVAERAVCLGDIPDDWGKGENIELYNRTFDSAISFAKMHPDTAWCYGNHDLAYMLGKYESGYSDDAAPVVRSRLFELNMALNKDNPMKYVHRIDNVLFSHGGVSEYFVGCHVPLGRSEDIDETLEIINSLYREMWNDASPIWYRPQHHEARMYRPEILQVVGHTPVQELKKERNIITTDLFSTYQSGEYIGTCEYAIIDTVTGDYYGVKSKKA